MRVAHRPGVRACRIRDRLGAFSISLIGMTTQKIGYSGRQRSGGESKHLVPVVLHFSGERPVRTSEQQGLRSGYRNGPAGCSPRVTNVEDNPGHLLSSTVSRA